MTRGGMDRVNALVRHGSGVGNTCCKTLTDQKVDERVHVKKESCWFCETSWTYQPATGWLPTAALLRDGGKT